VAYLDNDHDQTLVSHLIYETMVADTYSIELFGPFQLFNPKKFAVRILREDIKSFDDPYT